MVDLGPAIPQSSPVYKFHNSPSPPLAPPPSSPVITHRLECILKYLVKYCVLQLNFTFLVNKMCDVHF